MRVVKEADVRKNEILDAASELFAAKGFDATSVGDIMEAVGIAKGTLYHHFKSKEDIMDSLIERQTYQIITAAKEAAGDRTISVEERMLRTIAALHVDTEEPEGREMIRHLHGPQNALMQQKTKRILLQQIPPLLADILNEGIAQELFETPYPLECMEMAMCYLDNLLDDDVFQLTEQQRPYKIQAFIYHMERLLGVKEGRLSSLLKVFEAEGRNGR